jgi:PAS domain S-box-containing protein
MNDEDKTKEQLLQELARLRQRLTKIEASETERKQMEETLRLQANIVANMAGGVYIIGADDLIIRYTNPKFEKMFGYEPGELVGKHVSVVNAPVDKSPEEIAAEINRQLNRAGEWHGEVKNIRKDGTPFWCYANVSVFDHRDYGRVHVAIHTDITERMRAEEALKESEERYRELADFLPQTVFEFDTSGNFTFANRYGFQSFGYTPEDMEKGLNVLQLFIPEDRERIKKNIRMALGGRKPKNNEYTALRKDGSTYPVIIYSAPAIREGKPVGLRGVVFDITEHKRIENELHKSHEELRSLTVHLQSVREEERTDIARGVHDDLGQALTALKMDLSWLSKRLPREPESLLEKTKVMSGLLDSAILTVKKISTELRPGILDDFGLIAAIEWQAEEFHKRSGIKCTVSSVTEPHLDRELNTALFRIFQETLTNIARHTSATKVTVNIKYQDGKMIMRIRDNGKGITKEQLFSSSSFGIIGMRERVRALRGEIDIRGIPGKGTTVTAAIPLVKNGEA